MLSKFVTVNQSKWKRVRRNWPCEDDEIRLLSSPKALLRSFWLPVSTSASRFLSLRPYSFVIDIQYGPIRRSESLSLSLSIKLRLHPSSLLSFSPSRFPRSLRTNVGYCSHSSLYSYRSKRSPLEPIPFSTSLQRNDPFLLDYRISRTRRIPLIPPHQSCDYTPTRNL